MWYIKQSSLRLDCLQSSEVTTDGREKTLAFVVDHSHIGPAAVIAIAIVGGNHIDNSCWPGNTDH